MENWWEAAPLAQPEAAAFGDNWWEAAPLAAPPQQAKDPIYKREMRRAKASFNDVRVPAPQEVGTPDTPEQAAAEGVAHQRSQEAEQAAFDATRTPGKRVGDTAAFAVSMPVRMATRGEYGAGDVAGLVSKGAGDVLKKSEGDFVGANTGKSALETFDPRDIPTLATLQHAGEIAPGVPLMRSMGAVPGEAMASFGATVRNLPRATNRLLREDAGSGPIPGAPVGPPASLPQPARLPNRAETFAASDQLKQDLGAPVDVSEMLVGGNFKQSLAAGLKSIPFAGDPIEAAYTKGLGQLETATKAAGAKLGTASGREAAGEGLKEGAFGWMGKRSKEHLEALYEPVYAKIDPAATSPLSATGKLAGKLADEMKEGTTQSEAQALGLVKEGVERSEGLTVRGLARKRSEVGDFLDESKINKSPGQRALGRVYGALTDDLRAAIRQHGGDEALAAWDTANREARVVAIQKKRLAKVVGTDENKLSGGDVFNKAVAMGQERAGNSRGIDLLMNVVGDKQRGAFGAQLIDHMGIDPKTSLYSGDRFLSEYNKMSSFAKDRYFGASKVHLDNISTLALKFGQLSSKFNRSNTGVVNAVLKILNNPAAIGAHVATAAVNPMAGVTLGTQLGGLAAGRRVAWTLARPANAKKTANVFRAYYGVASAAGKGAAAVAAREQELSRSVRTLSMSVAQQTGANAAEVEASIHKALKGEQTPSKALSHDDIEAAIVRMIQGPERRFSIPELRKVFPDASDADFNTALNDMAKRGVIELPKK